MDLGLKGRRALVMGASKGLGRSVAEALAAEGVHLVISGRSQASLEEVATALRALGAASATGVAADVAELADMDRLAAAAFSAMGGVDILVLNHGGPPPGTALELDEGLLAPWFRRIVESPIRMVKALLPGMRAQRFGRIISIASTGLQQPIPNLVLSNTLRAALMGYLKTLSAEVAAEGVTVNMVAPGAIRTDRSLETAASLAAKTGKSVEEVIAERARSIPAGRYGEPAEFGPMVAFLCGAHASYITGEIIRIDGGIVRGF
ncbi:MAG: SDR family oxidoreductase [Rhodovarius sp.]|nr:SDR family oxidoreductase [Rhodovarius sp.]MDW8315440.1 SDR family oxidoreductase [Rhodovarius sp.]